MLIATVQVGDTLLTLTRVIPVTPDPQEQMTDTFYHLTLTDLPTDERYTHVVHGENYALCMVAAWIAADEPEGFPEIKRAMEELRNAVKGSKNLCLP